MSDLNELPLQALETNEQKAAVARLYGQPMLEMPRELYIPPDALEIFLEAFQGPLDLLLFLIRKNNIDILDIPMADLTRQYLVYVEAMRESNLELAAEYLLMAATLLEIKSRILLPRPKQVQEEEANDPRAELVRRLIEYEQMKQAAVRLEVSPRVGRDFEWVGVFVAEKIVEREATVSLHDLQLAWLAVMQRARINKNHVIERESLSVREHMSSILRQLQGQRFVVFHALFDGRRGVSSLVVNFLALLELVKEKLVSVVQNESLGEIYVRLGNQQPFAAGTEDDS